VLLVVKVRVERCKIAWIPIDWRVIKVRITGIAANPVSENQSHLPYLK